MVIVFMNIISGTLDCSIVPTFFHHFSFFASINFPVFIAFRGTESYAVSDGRIIADYEN
jgi:hypothetical protein